MAVDGRTGGGGPAGDVERRIVSVLFADLVGFTSLSERLDAEDVATIQDAYFATVRETIGRYGGQLEKFIGDAAMAVFGIPRGRDDDAERAVRAGLVLVAAVQGLGARLNLDRQELRLRVGVTTGEVVHAVLGPDAGRVTGDTVNTAARLQAAAEPGTVLVGEATALAVAEAVELALVPPLVLKGKRDPVPAWRAAALRPQRSRELAMGSLQAPTIGRDGEFATLAARLEAVVARAATERCLVLAPPGVGKTRLVDEFGRRAAAREPRPAVWRIRLRPEQAGSFEPIRWLATAALHDAGIDPAGGGPVDPVLVDRLAAAGLPQARAVVVANELLELVVPRPAPAPEVVPTDRSARFAAWLDGMDALAAGRTQVWLVEDLHWAGPDVVAFLDLAAERGSPAGRLVVATARPSFVDVAPGWAADDPSTGRHLLQLGTLPTTEAAELVHALVGDALPDPLVSRITEVSDGNCLFIEELLRTWVGTAALVPTTDGPGDWRLTVQADEIPLPTTVQAIYAAQLDDLPPEARQAARRGAVAGRRFPVRALETLGVPAPDRSVEELVRRALVGGPHPDQITGETFAYRHALLRDAGYASLARAERAELHVRLARWLEAAAGDDQDVVAAAIGEHLATALSSAPALAAEIAPSLSREACADQAAAWLERAGRRAMSSGALATAAELFRRAATLTRSDQPGERSRRLTLVGRALVPIGGLDDASDAFREAIDAAREVRTTGDPGWRTLFASATDALVSLLYERLRFLDAWRLGDAALAEMGERDDLDTARVRLARSRARSGETNDAGPWVEDAERALAAAHAAGDAEAEWECVRDVARARSEAGLATLDEWRTLGGLARARGDVGVEISARTMEAGWLMETAPAEVPAILGPARELAVARGLVERLGWVEHAEAEAALASGDWDRAIEAGMRAVRLGERHGFDRVAVRSWAALLPAASLRAETAILEQAAAWFEARAGTFPDSPYGRVLQAGADLWLARGGLGSRPTPTLEHLRPAFPQWLAYGSYEWLAAGDAVLDAWFATDHLDLVQEALDGILGTVPPDASRPAVLAAQVHRARLRAGRAPDHDDPRPTAEVRTVLEELRAIGIRFWIARGLRVIEALGWATDEETAERERIETALRVVRPTL